MAAPRAVSRIALLGTMLGLAGACSTTSATAARVPAAAESDRAEDPDARTSLDAQAELEPNGAAKRQAKSAVEELAPRALADGPEPHETLRLKFEEHVQALHELTLDLASAGSLEIRPGLADFFERMAAALRAEDVRAPAVTEVAELLFQAERLDRMEQHGFVSAEWIARALLAGLAVLETLLPDEQGEAARVWLTRARAAVDRLDRGQMLSFQRAVLQDSLRAAVDAFFAVAQARDRAGDAIGVRAR